MSPFMLSRMATRTTTMPAIKMPAQRAYHSLKVNGSRMMDLLHKTCDWGKAHPWGEHHTETGMARLSLNDDDKKVRDWLRTEAESLGCTVTIDQMGNMFAVRPGKVKDAAPVMMGSHLDTQPTGGRYDGILGVMAGLEVLRTLNDEKWETEGPVGLVNWTNEEGARFPMITVASGVWAGAIPLETAWNLTEVTPPTSDTPQNMKQELSRIGYLGPTPASHTAFPIAAHFELHIEQGPILEDTKRKIGVVTGAQAHSWFEVVVSGSDGHAGTTPISMRQDAVLAAAKMIVVANEVAIQHEGLITTGIVGGLPGSVNTVPHTAKFTLDVRHTSDDTVTEMVQQCKAQFDEIAQSKSERGVQVHWKTLTENKAVVFHEDCVKAVEDAAEEYCAQLPDHGSTQESKRWQHMTSGAGHDSCHVNKICPTAMIFATTRRGRSHTPDEYCPPEDCVAGAQVLLGAVMRYDAARF